MKKLFLLLIIQCFLHNAGKSQDEAIDFSLLEKKGLSLCKEGRYEDALSIFNVKKKQIERLSEDLQLEFF